MASSQGMSPSIAGTKIKSGRLPQAPTSLLIQLPPNELKKFQNASTSGSNGDLIDAESGNVGASDLHLLATSIQQRREREARVFQWQQRLIDADERLSRSDLKRAVSRKKICYPLSSCFMIVLHLFSSRNYQYHHGCKSCKRDISTIVAPILHAQGSQ